MLKILKCVVAFVCVAALVSALIPATLFISEVKAETITIVTSDNFEGDSTIFRSRGDAKVEMTSEVKHEGSKSLKISERGDGTWRGDEFAAASVLKPNGNYTVSGWVYLPEDASPTEFKIGGSIEWTDSSSESNKWPQFASVKDVQPGVWTRIEGNIALSDEAFDAYSIVFECMTEKQDFYIDDFVLTSTDIAKADTSQEQAIAVVSSDNFEGDSTIFRSRGDAKVEMTSEVKHEGSKSLKVSERGDGTWRGDEFAAASVLKPNGNYTVSGWVYLPEDASPTEFKIGGSIEWADSSSESNKWPQFASVKDVQPGVWTKLEGSIALSGEAFDSYSIVFECLTEKQDFYIDDFVLISTDIAIADTSQEQAIAVVSSDNFEGDSTIFRSRGEAKVELTSEVKHEGSKSLKVSERGDGTWRGNEFPAATVLKPNGNYTVSGWVYLPEDASPTEFKIGGSIEWSDSSSESNKWPQFASVKDVQPGVWTKLEGSIALSGEAFDSYSIVFECLTEKQDFYIDDFILTGTAISEADASQVKSIQDLTPLKDIYKDYFMIGTAIDHSSFDGIKSELFLKHFNSATAENAMKPEALQREKGVFTFGYADSIMDAAIDNDIIMIGHTLQWHQQSPSWMYSDVTKEEAVQNLTDHITTVLTHYKENYNGKIHTWDVINEAMNDNVANPSDWRAGLRESGWIKAVGTDLVEIAFRTAAEIAEPDVQLYYNDYNLDVPAKREAVYYMVKELKEKGVKIDGIGMQGHYNMGTSAQNVEDSIKRFAELGVKISFTELDVTVNIAQGLPSLTPELEKEQAFKYAELFKVFKKYADVIDRVTIWGMDDGSSWRGDRFPLVFDKYLQAKEVYYAIADPEEYYEDNYIEPAESLMSYAQYGTPVIDGEIDQIWDNAEAISVSNFVMAWEGATGTAKTLWNEDNLFVLFEVKDDVLNSDSENVYEHDSVEVFVDENNGKTSAYQLDDGQFRVSYENLQSFGSQGTVDSVNSAVKAVSEGYLVEVQIPFNSIKGSSGTVIGFEPQINDADSKGTRVSIAKWNDLTDYSWQSTEKWGRLTLVKSGFKDIAQVNWARSAIEKLAANGIINGITPDEFEPNANITQGEFVIALFKALDHIGVTADISSKVDFNADEPITREEMFDLVSQALLTQGASSADTSVLNAFNDRDSVSEYAVDGTSLLVQNGFVSGINSSTLNPQGNATRAQAATLLAKLLEN